MAVVGHDRAFSGVVGPHSFQPHAHRPRLCSLDLNLAKWVKAKAGQG